MFWMILLDNLCWIVVQLIFGLVLAVAVSLGACLVCFEGGL